jgi:hypothetical protein
VSDFGELVNPADAADLAAEVVNLQSEALPVAVRQGVVSSVTNAAAGAGSLDARIDVKVGGATTPTTNLRYLGSAPRVDDSVWMLQFGEADYLVLGPLAAALPPGAVIAWPTATPPPGWILCDGRSTAAYPNLVALSLPGGVVPDYRGRVLVGVNTATGEFQANTSGGNYHGHNHALGTLDDNAIGDHTHTIPAHKHAIRPAGNAATFDDQGYPASNVHKSFRTSDRTGGSASHGSDDNWMDGVGLTTAGGGGHNHSFTGKVGKVSGGHDGDADYANMPPWRPAYWIMKY